MLVRSSFVLMLCSLTFFSCGDSGSSGDGALTLGQSAVIEDGDEAFELTPTKMYRDGDYMKVDVTVTGRGPEGFDTTGLSFLTTLFAGREGVQSRRLPERQRVRSSQRNAHGRSNDQRMSLVRCA